MRGVPVGRLHVPLSYVANCGVYWLNATGCPCRKIAEFSKTTQRLSTCIFFVLSVVGITRRLLRSAWTNCSELQTAAVTHSVVPITSTIWYFVTFQLQAGRPRIVLHGQRTLCQLPCREALVVRILKSVKVCSIASSYVCIVTSCVNKIIGVMVKCRGVWVLILHFGATHPLPTSGVNGVHIQSTFVLR